MVESVAVYSFLTGLRGQPSVDLAALAIALSRLSCFAGANAAAIESFDINPFLVRPGSALAPDAVLVTHPPPLAASPRLRPTIRHRKTRTWQAVFTPKTIDNKTERPCAHVGIQSSTKWLGSHPTVSFMARDKDLERQAVTKSWMLASEDNVYRCKPRLDSRSCWRTRWLSSHPLTEACRMLPEHSAQFDDYRFASNRRSATSARAKFDETSPNETPVRTTRFQLPGNHVACYRVSQLIKELAGRAAGVL